VRPKFIADEDQGKAIVDGCKLREVDIITAREAGTLGLSDGEVLQKADEMRRVLVTHDCNTMIAHFFRSSRFGESPGLVVITQETPARIAIEALVTISEASDLEEWRARVQFVTPNGIV
jgi:predicted nuclease of predicted toxin-antitoxin system